jgi:hypothetical protein
VPPLDGEPEQEFRRTILIEIVCERLQRMMQRENRHQGLVGADYIDGIRSKRGGLVLKQGAIHTLLARTDAAPNECLLV